MSNRPAEHIATELSEKCAKARVVLHAICERTWAGKPALKWSIPARPQDDDLVIADALEAAEAAAALLRCPVPAGPLGEAGARLRALLEAFDRTVEYIRTAMRPISVKEACGETAYDRAERRGLQHGLNALIAEFGKAGIEYPASAELDALLSAPVVSGWQPIETLASADELVLMWTPVERLYSPPYLEETQRPDMRVSTRRHWTWATHWMPLPSAPIVTQEGEEPCP